MEFTGACENLTDAVKVSEFFLASESERYSCAEAQRQAKSLAGGLKKAGLKWGDDIVFRCDKGPESFAMLLALLSLDINLHFVNAGTNVIDYFNDESFEGTRGYLTREGSAEWVLVSLTEPDTKIVPDKAGECNAKGILSESNSLIKFSGDVQNQFTVSQIIGMIKEMVSFTGAGENDKVMITPEICDRNWLVLTLGAIISGYALMLPQSHGARHLLHCAEENAVTAVFATAAELSGMREFAEEYDLGAVNFFEESELLFRKTV